MRTLQAAPDAPRYLIDDMIDDVIERAAFLRFKFQKAFVLGDWGYDLYGRLQEAGELTCHCDTADCDFDEQNPFGQEIFDLVLNFGTLDTVNDLPGALIHIRNALSPGGLMIASFLGFGSLPVLRQAMLEADGDRPAPRIHPQVDVRAGGQLMQRAGFADPVVDSRSLYVSFRSLDWSPTCEHRASRMCWPILARRSAKLLYATRARFSLPLERTVARSRNSKSSP
jgi:SAM-dependent methyltransferase